MTAQKMISLQQDLLNKAICFAVEKHAGQCRKGTETPYIVHPLEVMQILSTMQADMALLAAGVLHDTVEDTEATLAELTEKFGTDVARLVGEHSEDKSLNWEERKGSALQAVAEADKREQMLVLADKLSNIRAMSRDFKRLGKTLWQRFRRPRVQQAWYYLKAVEALKNLDNFAETRESYQEFAHLVRDLFTNIDNIELLQEDFAERRLELFSTPEKSLLIMFNEHSMTITGADSADELTGGDSYECDMVLNELNTRLFFKYLRLEYGDESIDKLLKDHFSKEQGFYQLKNFFAEHHIVYELSSF